MKRRWVPTGANDWKEENITDITTERTKCVRCSNTVNAPFVEDFMKLLGVCDNINDLGEVEAAWEVASMAQIHFTRQDGVSSAQSTLKDLWHPNKLPYCIYINYLYETVKGLFMTPPKPDVQVKLTSSIVQQHGEENLLCFGLYVLYLLYFSQLSKTREFKVPLSPSEIRRIKKVESLEVRAVMSKLVSDKGIYMAERPVLPPALLGHVTFQHYLPNKLEVSANVEFPGANLSEVINASANSTVAISHQLRRDGASEFMSHMAWDVAFIDPVGISGKNNRREALQARILKDEPIPDYKAEYKARIPETGPNESP